MEDRDLEHQTMGCRAVAVRVRMVRVLVLELVPDVEGLDAVRRSRRGEQVEVLHPFTVGMEPDRAPAERRPKQERGQENCEEERSLPEGSRRSPWIRPQCHVDVKDAIPREFTPPSRGPRLSGIPPLEGRVGGHPSEAFRR